MKTKDLKLKLEYIHRAVISGHDSSLKTNLYRRQLGIYSDLEDWEDNRNIEKEERRESLETPDEDADNDSEEDVDMKLENSGQQNDEIHVDCGNEQISSQMATDLGNDIQGSDQHNYSLHSNNLSDCDDSSISNDSSSSFESLCGVPKVNQEVKV